VPEYADHASRGDYNQFQLTPPVFEPGFHPVCRPRRPPPVAAQRMIRGIAQHREECRDMRRVGSVEDLV
jgi:hypothetical protein